MSRYLMTLGEYVRADGEIVVDAPREPPNPAFPHPDCDLRWRLHSTAVAGTREEGVLAWTWEADR